jgi:hypothetical protein
LESVNHCSIKIVSSWGFYGVQLQAAATFFYATWLWFFERRIKHGLIIINAAPKLSVFGDVNEMIAGNSWNASEVPNPSRMWFNAMIPIARLLFQTY